MDYDFILKGGTLIDPYQGINGPKDIAFKDGVVADLCDAVSGRTTGGELDCTGFYVSPGFIDLHVHVFWGVGRHGISPDAHCLSKGVTTILDAGTCGADTFPGFKKYIVQNSSTRVLAYLHISSIGILNREVGELKNMDYANAARALETIKANRDVIKGVKVRLTQKLIEDSAGLKPLAIAREVADHAELPVMVHPQNADCDSLDRILDLLRKGDILTHCFHPKECGILDKEGQLRPSVKAAQQRGIVFDVGHGRGSFSWRVVEAAIKQGFYPDTISSDLHAFNTDGPVYDLPTTLSKFLYLKLPLQEVIAKATDGPAKALGMSGQIGTLKPGARGDAVVFKLIQGKFDYADSRDRHRIGDKRIIPIYVIKDGKPFNISYQI